MIVDEVTVGSPSVVPSAVEAPGSDGPDVAAPDNDGSDAEMLEGRG